MQALRKIGFSETIIDMYRLLGNNWYSIQLICNPKGLSPNYLY